MVDCILRHDVTLCCEGFKCHFVDKICAWDAYDYSDPKTKLITYLVPGTPAKIIFKKFPGVLVGINDGTQYWICEWDVH